jgi:DNA sulfur modification protein DndD
MIIEKIELENFMCYAGKQEMEFTEGINVIIGDNGYGKSKLYDAFYWAMHDQVFVPEKKEFQKTNVVKSKIISDKALFETEEGEVTASVRISFHNLEKDYVYILERKYTITINNGQRVEGFGSELTLYKKDLAYLDARIVSDNEEVEKVLARILPPQVKEYLWFQGEQVESIIDFNKQDTLTKAINVLSNITRYDEIKEMAISLAKAARIEYDRELKRLSKDTGKSEQLQREKEQLEKLIERLLREESELKENLSKAEEKSESLLNQLDDAQKINELQQKKKILLIQLGETKETANEEQIGFHKRMFKNKWVLKGTEGLQKEYSRKFDEYDQRKLEDANKERTQKALEKEVERIMEARLPIDVPEPIYIQRMLEQEKCLVCSREAKRGSDAWNKIKELIDRPVKQAVEKQPEKLPRQDFLADLKRLYQNGLSLTHRIEDVEEDIQEAMRRIHSFSSKIKKTTKDLQKADEDIESVLKDTSLTTDIASNIIAEYSIQNNKVKNFIEDLNRTSQKLEEKRNGLRTINDQLQSLVKGDIPAGVIQKRDVLSDFELIAISTRGRVFNNLIQQLEAEANLHYAAMTAGNKATRGKIRLRKLPNDNYMPEINDENGNPLLGANTSNLILVKLAAIMAIISAKSNAGMVDLYTLITDAPTSVFGEDYTIGFCKTISKVYRQSIIMSKEFYKNQKLREELLKSPDIKIGKVYTITPSILETERDNRNNLSTTIKALN